TRVQLCVQCGDWRLHFRFFELLLAWDRGHLCHVEEIMCDRNTQQHSPDAAEFVSDEQDNQHNDGIQMEAGGVNPGVEHICLKHMHNRNHGHREQGVYDTLVIERDQHNRH